MNRLRRGRPPQYVRWQGRVIIGLSKKSDGRYYSTHASWEGRRVYFGSELPKAVKRFQEWVKTIPREIKQICQ